MIRITGGKNRSRLLETPDTELTKPTMDKVRAGVFNALSFDIENAVVLDLFAGSGSYGFEALSRGAKEATFVDKSLMANSALKNNKTNLKEECAFIEYKDALMFLKETTKQFDIIFVDPPYKLDVYSDIIKLIEEKDLLTNKGILVLETENELNIDESKFSKVRMYSYGLAKVYILRK